MEKLRGRFYSSKTELILLIGLLTHAILNKTTVWAGDFIDGDIEYSSSDESDEEKCELLPPQYSNASGSLQDKKFDMVSLLKHGTDLIDQNKYVDKTVLILGNTGSGKTTISQILSGNLDSLHAVVTQSDRMVIIDDNFKISGPSTTSKTLIPELVIVETKGATVNRNVTSDDDTEDKHTTFYDCPGFDDTRGPDEDLAANFFMNHVVRRKVNKVKMLFLVIHSSIKLGNDRLDFDLLVNHAIKFVQNLPKYGNSIGLVVTKVGNYNARRKYIRDKTILREIVEFLELYNNDMRIKLTSGKITPEERDVINKKIKFVEILLQRNKNGVYTKIAFSRDPENCGPLSKSLAVAQTRKRLQNLYENELEYRSANFSDFGYTLKDSTSLSIRHISQNINKDIASVIQKVTSQFESWTEKEKLKQAKNYTEILSFVENTCLELSKLVGSLESYSNSSVNVVEISNLFKASLRKLGYHVSSQVDQFMERQQAYIEFFEADDISKILETWAESIKMLHDDSVGIKAWYTFCQDLEEKVTLYSFQGRKESMTGYSENKNVSSRLRFLEVEAKLMVPSKVKEFGRKLEGDVDREYLINRLVEVTDFATKPSGIYCIDNTVYITGNFVRVSEFAAKLHVNSICSNNYLVKKLEVYASHTLFIDEDISAVGRQLNVVIVAPKWKVIGQRKFNLQGSSPHRVYPIKAKSGRHWFGENGENGVPGKPGGPGGSLFGVAGQVDVEAIGGRLQINCDGGSGGQGQDGGDGGRGADGRSTPHGSNSWERRDANVLWMYTRDRTEYDGYSGHPGGNGGLGGFGGEPGIPGKVDLEIIGVNSTQSTEIIRISRRYGELGVHGNSGQGGIGGEPGNSMSCYKSRFLIFKWGDCSTLSPRGETGRRGQTWRGMYTSLGAESSKVPQYSIVKWESLFQFKKNFDHFRLHLNETAQNLMKMIDLNPVIMGDRTVQIYFYVNVFLSFGQHLDHYSLSSIDVDANFSTLRDFIKTFERYLKQGHDSMNAEQKKMSKLLLATAYSNLVNWDQGLSSLEYFEDVQSYLTGVKQQLEQYSPTNIPEKLLDVQQKYERDLLTKVEDFHHFLESVVVQSIDLAEFDQTKQLETLDAKFTEILNATDEVEWENSKWQFEKNSDIREALELKQAFDVVPITMGTINIMGSRDVLELFTTKEEASTTSTRKFEEFLMQVSNLSQSLQVSIQSGEATSAIDRAKEFISGCVTLELYNEFTSGNDTEKIGRMEYLIDQVIKMSSDFQERKVTLQLSLINFLEAIKTHTYIHLSEWKVKAHLHNVKQTLMTLIDGIDSKVYLNLFDRIQDALTMLIDYYDTVEQYQNVKPLAIYMVNATNDLRFRDSRFNLEAPQLLNVLEHNILSREYQKALHAFRQSVFPFGKLYRSEKAPQKSSFPQAQTFYVKQIESLEAEVVDRVKTRNGTYGVTRQMDFYRNPFFVWENSKWSGEIADLLAGKKVQLKADIRQAVDIPDAVKFHLVELNFKVKNGVVGGFRKHLENRRVTMTHSGTSYYRLNNKFYVMTGKNITIRYNFETEGLGSGEELVENGHVDNEAEGDVVHEKMFQMSPYTLWTVQLEKVGSENGTSTTDFGELQRWAKVVDAELVGKGVYVENGDEDLEVDKYYQRDYSLCAVDLGFNFDHDDTTRSG